MSKSNRKKMCVGGFFFVRSWLCAQERWILELIKIFGAAARYRRATVGSSRNDTHPDYSMLHAGRIYYFSLLIGGFVLLLLRQRRGAAATSLEPRSSTCEKQQAAPQASA
jgi:hypothetical protein